MTQKWLWGVDAQLAQKVTQKKGFRDTLDPFWASWASTHRVSFESLQGHFIGLGFWGLYVALLITNSVNKNQWIWGVWAPEDSVNSVFIFFLGEKRTKFWLKPGLVNWMSATAQGPLDRTSPSARSSKVKKIENPGIWALPQFSGILNTYFQKCCLLLSVVHAHHCHYARECGRKPGAE